jgi:hypothetical protein|nr:MAG TPA: hypothetical protein [Caudoviricetes sp.]
MKRYIAKTNVSINIVLPTGANRHIAFSSLTGGGSVFYTDDPEIQNAMERHYKFGTLFRIDNKYAAEKQRNKPAPKPKAQATTDTTEAAPATDEETEPSTDEQPTEAEADEAEAETDNGLKTIVVSDPDAAKAYLAEHFGLSRTKIKTLKAIKEAATANGIVFEGI